MTKTREIDFDAGIAFTSKGNGALISFKGAGLSEMAKKPKIEIDRQMQLGWSEIIPWGTNNKFPHEVIADIRKSPELGSNLKTSADLLVSGRLIWGIPDYSTGKRTLKPIPQDENRKILSDLRMMSYKRYLIEAARDMKAFSMVFIRGVLSRDKSKIVQFSVTDASHCRWGKQNEKTGFIDTCYINANWHLGALATSPETIKLPVIDPYFDPVNQLKNLSGFEFIYPLNYPSLGSMFYQLADWNSVRESGWLKIAEQVPSFKNKLLEQKMYAQWHIQIAQEYWSAVYEGFEDMETKEKKAIVEKTISDMEDCLQGVDNAGKNLITRFAFDENGNEQNWVKVTALDKKMQDEIFLKDDERATEKIHAATALHPALRGFSSSGQSQGGGSDIREAYNLNIIANHSERNFVLEPFELLRDYNGYPFELEFELEQQFMTTLDAGKETQSTQPTKN